MNRDYEAKRHLMMKQIFTRKTFPIAGLIAIIVGGLLVVLFWFAGIWSYDMGWRPLGAIFTVFTSALGVCVFVTSLIWLYVSLESIATRKAK